MALHKRVLNWVLKPFRKKAPAPAWKQARDIQKITLGNTRLGTGAYGYVYIGSIKFKDGSRQRVAIKGFHTKISDKQAMAYQQVINDLVNAGVRLPKTGMVKLPSGEWVQVSQLFSSAQKTKISNYFSLDVKLETKIEAVKELVKIANAGYTPNFDVIGVFTGSVEGSIPHDIDMLVKEGKTRPGKRGRRLNEMIRAITMIEPEQKKILFDTALNTACPEMKKAIEKILKK